MAQIFPEWTNRLPLAILATVIGGVVVLTAGIWYYGSPWYTDVGYMPVQPAPYSHKLHVGELGMDCRYCHIGVETSPVAMVPPTQTCMNCHTMVLPTSEKFAPVRTSWESGEPMQWVRIHKSPDYVYFDHSAHVNVGVGCESCHGNIAQMEEVHLDQPLSMDWCLACHRNPEPHLRPLDEVTVMGWVAPANQADVAAKITAEFDITPPQNCSGCHR